MKKTLNITQPALLILLLTFCFGIGNSMADPGPQATTTVATNIIDLSATLNGFVNANGEVTNVRFQYGTSVDYSEIGPDPDFPITVTGSTPTAVALPISGLTDNTLYHFRVKATQIVAETEYTAYGQDMTFFVGTPSPPVTTTTSASSVTSFGATVNGTVNSGGAAAVVTFEYGTSASYGTTVLAVQTPVISTSDSAVTAELSELQNGTTYHFRVSATSDQGTSTGSDMTFTTVMPPPSVTTEEATSRSNTSAILNGTVNAFGNSTAVTFEYGPDTSYGTTVSADQSPITGSDSTSVSKSLSGLSTGTTYHYRTIGENGGGTTYGSDMSFTTLVNGPNAVTNRASKTTSVSATLNGTVNANNLETTVTFQYGTNTTYGRSIPATPATVTGDDNTTVTLDISNLTPNETYYFRVVAENSGGIVYGSDLSFIAQKPFPWSLFLNRINKEN